MQSPKASLEWCIQKCITKQGLENTTVISFDRIPFHARPTIPKPRISLSSHISPGHFCPEKNRSHEQKGVGRPCVRDPDLRDIISSIVDNNKAGTASGRIFPGRLSTRGEGQGKERSWQPWKSHGAGEQCGPGRQRRQEG